MRRRDFLTSAAAGVSLPGLAAAKPARKPNVIVILADDLGFGDLGVHGCRDIPTPNIDSIARNGVRFTNAFVSAPYCSPTRAGLMTGRYQERFGHEFNAHSTNYFLKQGGDPKKQGLPLTETTFADRMRASGYATGAIGKWHLGSVDVRFHPLRRGFDEFYGFLEGGHDYLPGHYSYGRAPIHRNYDDTPFDGYLTDLFGREAVSFIDRHQRNPFFLYFAPNAVHGPMQATDQYLSRFPDIADKTRRTYAALLSSLDDHVGAILTKLREARLENDTLIFFLSDNGGPINKFAINGSRNGPFRGGKGDLWEGGIHVPFFMQWKGRLPAGAVYNKSIMQLDILPTSLAAAGVGARPEWKLDGVDLFPYIRHRNHGEPHRSIFWRFGKMKAARIGDWKIVRTWDNTSLELYDLATDTGESHDLSERYPSQVRELDSQWQRWNEGLAPPAWPMPEADPPPMPRERQGPFQ